MNGRPQYRKQSAALLRGQTEREHVVFTGRGATAIWLALKAFGLVDHPVLIPANTCYIVLWAVLLSGNRPVLVDVDPVTGMITPDTLTACGVERPGAVIPCHLYGLPAPMAAITAWARENGARVIEDAALAFGNQVEGQPAGSWGDAAIFSFGTGKLVSFLSGGGALLTNDAALAAEARRLLSKLPRWTEQRASLERQWLDIYWATHQHEDANPRIAELYPKLFELYNDITLHQPDQFLYKALVHSRIHMESNRKHRRDYSTRYDRLIGGSLHTIPRSDDAVLWRYPLLCPPELRDDLFERLLSWHVDATRWYPTLRPMVNALAPQITQPPTPNADWFCARIINLPLPIYDDPPDKTIKWIQEKVQHWERYE